jgi:hypothetical protein
LPDGIARTVIAAEPFDIVTHPFQRGDQIHHARHAGLVELGRRAQVSQVQIAETGQPMIYGHHHHVAEPRQLSAVKTGSVAGAGGKTSAMEGHQHGALLAVVDGRRPDIQREAILAHAARLQVPLDHHAVVAAQIGDGLRADLSVGQALAHAGPGCRFPRRHEAVLAAGGCAVGDAFELLDASIGDALDLPAGGLHFPEKLPLAATAHYGGRARRSWCLRRGLRGDRRTRGYRGHGQR